MRVARLHLPVLGGTLTVLTQEHTGYMSVKIEGRFKDGHCRCGAVRLSRDIVAGATGQPSFGMSCSFTDQVLRRLISSEI